MKTKSPGAKRAYRQSSRADAAEERGRLMLDAFMARMHESWFDEIRLEDIASDAGVTVQTVIRRFGGKDGLINAMCDRLNAEITSRRAVEPGDIDGALRVLLSDYEITGDLVMRALAQEDRYPAVKHITDVGRASHRAWIKALFAPWLAALAPKQARAALDALVVATDLYVWKLIRRDMKRSQAELAALMRQMISAVLSNIATTSPDLISGVQSCPAPEQGSRSSSPPGKAAAPSRRRLPSRGS